MKKTISYCLIACVSMMFTACYKTYTCKCDLITTGQIKTLSKSKAIEKCSSSCQSGHTTTVE